MPSQNSDILSERLLPALRKHFGYSEFRSLQREIIESSLEQEDVLAVLPTGAGKSLCYQLPALLREGLTVVISPLIALMKDQVDALQELGVPATFLNSSLEPQEAKERWRGLFQGQYKLLYLSPERLMLEGMSQHLQSWNLSSIAVDEAHCISAWGHDFRPEYRSLAQLRQQFPVVPIMALTATATSRVRDDIVQLLGLRKPRTFVASFNRPNLSYRIVPKQEPSRQIVQILADHQAESGIIYCLSRARTEEVATALSKRGISALAYHAGLDASERAKRQDRFIRDEVSVMVATVAFGMGVDKPDVRFVIHYDLPKNLESYYQETGRAGRDGLPSECVLLYSSGDTAKLYSFIEQTPSEDEQRVARQQLSRLVDYCESAACRRVALLRYFGEQYRDESGNELNSCGACDNCLSPRAEQDAAQDAKKFLSCILRIQRQSGFSVGLQHVVDVLCGADTEKIRRWEHQSLSTYGIGKSQPRSSWLYLGKELLRLGLVTQNIQRFNVLEVSSEGMSWLTGSQPLLVRAPLVSARLAREKKEIQRKRTGAITFDSMLFERLRSWRKQVAHVRGIPAYMVLQDGTLQHIAGDKPGSRLQLSRINGMGEKKLAQYGEDLLEIVRSHTSETAGSKQSP